ncbi:hypothetical protein EI555_010460 [Monodon monoceros]|uniref:Calreticulin n=1 Tax=Monodon monoceros TaxID=40151 RepID=A0A4U1FJB8_MONMO|nr:hypothetical protein EI555_010460 [Monodon monoceros]
MVNFSSLQENFTETKHRVKVSRPVKMPSFMPLSTRFKKPFSNENETLVVQFSVKHKQGIHCGGGFVKLFPDTLNQEDMHSESEYYIMFGRYHENNKTIKRRINKDTHLYALIIRPNATYEVKIDNWQVAAGDLEDNWDFLPPRKIKAPYARKPRKWDECLQIKDPEDKKPETSNTSQTRKPDDWNEAMNGEWEGPLIPNLKYKGQCKPRIIHNLSYQGEWIHPEIDNPEYKPDPAICHYYNISVRGLDLWRDIEKQWRELYKEMEKRKQEKEAKKKKEKEEEREDDIWGIEEGSEEDSAEDPGNYRQLKEDDDERAFLGKNVEVHVDQRMNHNWVTSGYYSEANDVA